MNGKLLGEQEVRSVGFSEVVDQGFSTRVPWNPRVPREVTRGSLGDHNLFKKIFQI